MVANSNLAVVGQHEPSQDDWSEARKQFILKTFCGGADEKTAGTFLELCQRRRLSPEARHVYLVNRAAAGKAPNWVIQTGIDGYRLIADRTGRYAGSDDPVFVHDPEGRLAIASVTVRKVINGSVVGSFTASARWDEYAAGSPLWNKMPHTMLAKCFSDDTEVLTDRGFEPFWCVTGRVMQVTETGLEPTDATPFAQRWSGNMVTLDSDDLNFSVTPNHDMLTTEGKIEAGAMFARTRARPNTWIPRCVTGTAPDYPISDQAIRLAAAYLADGIDKAGAFYGIEVSRPNKVELLREIGGSINEFERKVAGQVAHTAVRTITTRSNKRVFVHAYELIEPLCRHGKIVRLDTIRKLSRRQARLLVDTWVAFDGSANKRSGVRRFYTSRIDHRQAFDVAAVAGGYAISPWTERFSDISSKPNYYATISGRSEIPVVRWNREYHTATPKGRKSTGLEITENASGTVWCVTVPSGVIVVRRKGFSMLCGNCAEALALRKAFPEELSGMYTDAEMDQADAPAPRRVVNRSEITTKPVAITQKGAQPAETPSGERLTSWTVFWNQLKARKIDAALFASLVGKAANTFSDPQVAMDALNAAEDLIEANQGDDDEQAIDAEYVDVDVEVDADEAYQASLMEATNADRHTR